MKILQLNIKFFPVIFLLPALLVLGCADVPRNNPADKGGDSYDSVYSDNRITSFSFINPAVTGVINETDSTIVVPVLYGTDVENLAAEFRTNAEFVTISGREQRSGITVNDFSKPLYYTVIARDGSSREYTVTTRQVSISAFSVIDYTWLEHIRGTVNYDNNTISIRIPFYMNKSNLVASFSAVGNVSVGGILQQNGITVNDFSNDVIYEVEDQNGVMLDYTVKITYKDVTVSHYSGSAGGEGSIDGTGAEASFRGPTGMTSDLNFLYVTDTNNHTIRKIDMNTGSVVTIAGSPGEYGSTDGTGSEARFYFPEAITTDGKNLYVADTNNNRIRKIVISTGVVTTIAGTGTAGADDDSDGFSKGITSTFNNPGGITNDGVYLYVTDKMYSNIRRISLSTGVVSTPYAASLNSPRGITTDGTDLYVVDTGHYLIKKVVINGGAVSTVAGTSQGYNDGIATVDAQFNFPQHVVINGTNLYVSDGNNATIRLINTTTGTVSTIAGTHGVYGSSDGFGPAAKFRQPCGMALKNGVLYVSNSLNNNIRTVRLSDNFVSTLAGTANEAGSTDSDSLSDARFYRPSGITSDGTYFYVCDTGNNKIRRISIATGIVTTIAGTGAASLIDDADGYANGISSTFYSPTGITTDGTNIFVVDYGNSRIRQIVIATGVVTTIAGSGSWPWGASDDADGYANGISSMFDFPYGITTDGTNLYVCDQDNHRISQIVISTGVVTTLAGGSYGSMDGTGTEAKFYYPYGITTDGSSLYVADSSNHTIRKIVISTGVVSTLAGTALSSGSADGIGAAARFNNPRGIATDGNSLYVADTSNNLIRKIVISTGEVSTITGCAGISGNTDGSGSRSLFNKPVGIVYYYKQLYVSDSENNTIRHIIQ